MMLRRAALWAAAIVLASISIEPSRGESRLVVCLDENIPLLSVHHGGKSSGFDLAVADAVAKHLGLTLAVQWFESKLEEDASTTLAADALLSDGRCQLVGGYPLTRDALGRPGVKTARMPDFDGAKPEDRKRRVALGELVPTAPYRRAPMTLVLAGGDADRQVTGLADLKGMRIGAESGTLSDLILMVYDNGALVGQIHHFIPGRNELIPRMEEGDFDATLIDLRRFDAYRAAHPETKLKPSGYYYPVGFNMGFVGLARSRALIKEVDKAIGDLRAKDELAPLAQSEGLTYVAPRPPDVLDHLTLTKLRSE